MSFMKMGAYAKHRNVSLATVKQWIEEGKLEGCIKFGSNNRKQINQELADKALAGESTPEPIDHKQEIASGNTSLTKARTAKVVLEAKASQLKYEQLVGNLVEKAVVVKTAKEMAFVTRDALMTIPDRLAPVLASESNIEEINYILTAAINEALRNLSMQNYNFFKGEVSEEE